MAFVRTKEIPPGSGNRYRYLVRSVRDGDKVRQEHIRYLGPDAGVPTTKNVTAKYWPGEPEEHSEAAKRGWEKRRLKEFFKKDRIYDWQNPPGNQHDDKEYGWTDNWYAKTPHSYLFVTVSEQYNTTDGSPGLETNIVCARGGKGFGSLEWERTKTYSSREEMYSDLKRTINDMEVKEMVGARPLDDKYLVLRK